MSTSKLIPKAMIVGASTIAVSCLISYDVNAGALVAFSHSNAQIQPIEARSIVHNIAETAAQRRARLLRSNSDGSSQNGGGFIGNRTPSTGPAPAVGGGAPPPVPARTYPRSNQPTNIPAKRPSAYDSVNVPLDSGRSSVNQSLPTGVGGAPPQVPPRTYPGANQPRGAAANPRSQYDSFAAPLGGAVDGNTQANTNSQQYTPGYGPVPVRNPNAAESPRGLYDNTNTSLSANASGYDQIRPDQMLPQFTPGYGPVPVRNPLANQPGNGPTEVYSGVPTNDGYQSLPASAGYGGYGPLPTTDGYQSLPADANLAWRRQQEADARARGIQPVYGNANNPSIGQYNYINPQQPVYGRPNIAANDPNYQTLPLAPLPRQNDGYQPLPAEAGNDGYQSLPAGAGYVLAPPSLAQQPRYRPAPSQPANGNYNSLPSGAGYALAPRPQTLPATQYTPAPSQPANGSLPLPPPPPLVQN